MRSYALLSAVVVTWLACGGDPDAPPRILDPSCSSLEAELATCRESPDSGKPWSACKITPTSLAQCRDICRDPAQCEIALGKELMQMSAYLGEYSVTSSFQNVPADWPGNIELVYDTTVSATGIPLSTQRRDVPFALPVSIIEKDGSFAVVGAVRHASAGCSGPNLEIFVLKGIGKGTGKQLGCLPMTVTHTHMNLQWCPGDILPKKMTALVQFTATWKRILGELDRCAP